jgi:GntR family transcriptional repressor for pyruvate dehydrogenase complex
MPRQMDRLQFRVLDLLAETTTPCGSGALLEGVRGHGVAVSQATLGRALRVLDRKALTVKVSNKGRLITPEGRQWLAAERRRESTVGWAGSTLQAVSRSTLTELRESMIARRALEREIARLAAERATAQQIDDLRHIVENQAHDIEVGGRGAAEAVDFHVGLARVCGNRFLTAAVSLVRSNSRVLEDLMYHLGATVGTSFDSHIALLDAIASRDPRTAEEAMVHHIDELIQDIDGLLGQLNERNPLVGMSPMVEEPDGKQILVQSAGRIGRPNGLGREE